MEVYIFSDYEKRYLRKSVVMSIRVWNELNHDRNIFVIENNWFVNVWRHVWLMRIRIMKRNSWIKCNNEDSYEENESMGNDGADVRGFGWR